MKLAFVIALLLHGLLIVLLLFTFFPRQQHSHDGSSLQAYVYHNTQLIGKGNLAILTAMKPLLMHGTQRQTIIKQHQATDSPQKGHYNQWLIMLHNDIQRQLEQNNQWLAFTQPSAATVCFHVLKQGAINAIYFKQKSNLAAFDQAIKQAVLAIQPISMDTAKAKYRQTVCVNIQNRRRIAP